MATRKEIILIDDLTGDLLPVDGGQTVHFALDGVEYEMELSHKNAAEMREVIGRYINAGRRQTIEHRRRERARASQRR